MLHVERSGSGPDLVMLHGWALHGGVFDALAQRLQAHFRIHRVDLPGHGRSRDSRLPLGVDSVLEALGPQVDGATWLGWSLGGVLALEAALGIEPAPRGLVMLAASPRFLRADDWPHAVDPALLESMRAGLEADSAQVIERFIALEALGSDRAREDARRLRGYVFDRPLPAPSALAEGLALLREADHRAELPGLRCPSLWIAGRRDRLMPPAALEAAAAASPGGRFVRIDGGGHAPFLGHLDEVVEAVLAFTGDYHA